MLWGHAIEKIVLRFFWRGSIHHSNQFSEIENAGAVGHSARFSLGAEHGAHKPLHNLVSVIASPALGIAVKRRATNRARVAISVPYTSTCSLAI